MEKTLLSQTVADQLISMEKIFEDKSPINMPNHIEYKRMRKLVSINHDINFLLDITCARNPNSSQGTNQLRVETGVLLRLDYNVTAPHTNPDGKILLGSHLHRYVEGFRARWASRPSDQVFSEFTDRRRTLREFLEYCNVREIPTIN